MQILRDGARRGLDVADIRLLVCIQGSGHTDSNEIDVPDETEVRSGCQHPILNQSDEIPVHDITDVVVPGIDHVDLLLLNIESDSPETGLSLLNGKR